MTREEQAKAFADAEASLKLEGLSPSTFYYTLKAKMLDGKLTTEQAKAEIAEFYDALNQHGHPERRGG